MGTLASEFCAKTLHLNLTKDLCSNRNDSKCADSSNAAAQSEQPNSSQATAAESSSSSALVNDEKKNAEPAAEADPAIERDQDDEFGLGVYRDFPDSKSSPRLPHLSNIAEGIKKTFLQTDKEFLEKYRVSRDGCTAVVALILGNWVFVASVGDSAAILGFRDERGSLKASKITTDHKPNRADEKTRIEKNGAKVIKVGDVYRVTPVDYEARVKRIKMAQCSGGGSSERPPVALAVSRAFGDREFKTNSLMIAEPDITLIELKTNHKFLFMACDGVWDVMNEEEVCNLISRHEGDPHAASSAVVTEAFRRGSQDNLTSVTIFLNGLKSTTS
eukprot:Selendium_serpulae@DN6458_c0_g1_i1.p1